MNSTPVFLIGTKNILAHSQRQVPTETFKKVELSTPRLQQFYDSLKVKHGN